MKLVVASIWRNYSTSIVDDEGIEQKDGYTAAPRSRKLTIRFYGVRE